jgi:hypothetical protein
MRGWGKAPICKASRLDHRLGIHATCSVVEEGKKGRHGGKRKTYKECRDERLSSRFRGRTMKESEF